MTERRIDKILGRTLSVALCLFAAVAAGADGLDAEQKAKLDSTLNELTAIISQQDIGMLELTKGTLLATQFYASGKSAVPHLSTRFSGSRSAEEAMLSGLYLALNGNDENRTSIRRQLETNPRKRSWVAAMMASETAMVSSVEGGMEWREYIKVLPATGGCTKLALLCMESKDPLVRRFGLYSGFWMPSGAYWKSVQSFTSTEKDPLTRRFANYLLKMGRKQ